MTRSLFQDLKPAFRIPILLNIILQRYKFEAIIIKLIIFFFQKKQLSRDQLYKLSGISQNLIVVIS